jgi:PLP dependent protein
MSVAGNLEKTIEDIRRAEHSAGRREGTVKLLAVSKFHPADSVIEAIGCGQTMFGENRVQEASEKFPGILASNPEIAVHLIGNLQRNKAKAAVSLFSCIQSIDRAEILREVGLRAEQAGRTIEVLFEFHTGEDSKAGYLSEDTLFKSIDMLRDLTSLRCRGLMTMAPFTDDEGAIRKSFRSLASLRERCAARYPSLDFSELSMGMSSDYRIAIEEGSTMVRIGTAIFGERPHTP